MNAPTASELRQRLDHLRAERHRLEEVLLGIRRLLRGSLLARYHGSRGYRRHAPAYYVSQANGDQRRLMYVRKADLDRVQREVDQYRRFRKGLRRLRELSREILDAFRALCRSVEGPELER